MPEKVHGIELYSCVEYQTMRDLDDDLRVCFRVLPRLVHSLIRRTNFWLNTTYQYGPMDRCRSVAHAVTHHDERWLI